MVSSWASSGGAFAANNSNSAGSHVAVADRFSGCERSPPELHSTPSVQARSGQRAIRSDMKASLFNLLSALSLLLCVATAVLWVRSYTGSDYIDRRRLTAV